MKRMWMLAVVLSALFVVYVGCGPTGNPTGETTGENTPSDGGNVIEEGIDTSKFDTNTTDKSTTDTTGTDTTGTDTPAPTDEPQKVCFTRDIMPIFATSCAKSGCHDSTTKAEGIELTSYEKILASAGGRGVIPSNSTGSEVYQVITTTGRKMMPPAPASPLTADQIALIKKWIDEGAENTSCN